MLRSTDMHLIGSVDSKVSLEQDPPSSIQKTHSRVMSKGASILKFHRRFMSSSGKKIQQQSQYFVEERNPSTFFKRLSQSIQFRFKSGGWMTPRGKWALLWVKPDNVEVPTNMCKKVTFQTTAGKKVQAWKC